jgi:hypothetical protein
MGGKRKKLSIDDTTLWYLVGVITTDGCLSSDRRHIDITAKDREYLELLRNRIGVSGRVAIKRNGQGDVSHHIQIGNVELYEFLLSIGLSPKKSLIQKEVHVPLPYFADFCRGVIDGDGNIRKWTHPTNQKEQWVLRIYSSSREFIFWLQGTIENIFCAKGRIYREKKDRKNEAFVLKYGKMAAVKILKDCYYANALAMERKARLAQECC